MKRSAPTSVRLSGRRSTTVPANVPKSASGKNPASDASESMLAEFVEIVMCHTKPICRMELVSTEASSPPHTHASLSCQESRSTASSPFHQRSSLVPSRSTAVLGAHSSATQTGRFNLPERRHRPPLGQRFGKDRSAYSIAGSRLSPPSLQTPCAPTVNSLRLHCYYPV